MWWSEFKHGAALGILILAANLLAVSEAMAETPSAPPTSDVMEEAKAQLNATFKNFQFEKMEPSPISGLVEIYAAGRIIYYAPKEQILLMGEMYSANGVSLTQERVAEFAGERASEIDRSVALVMGEGEKEIIEFVDPDCGHCRAAYQWFSTEKPPGVRHLIYFMPMKGRPQAEARVLELLCAKPEQRAEALSRVFKPAGPVDLQKAVRCREGLDQLAAQARVAQAVGVYATPFYVIDGKVTAGFNAEAIAAQLAGKPTAVSQAQK